MHRFQVNEKAIASDKLEDESAIKKLKASVQVNEGEIKKINTSVLDNADDIKEIKKTDESARNYPSKPSALPLP